MAAGLAAIPSRWDVPLTALLFAFLMLFWGGALLFGRYWFMARIAGVPLGLGQIVGLRLRRADVRAIVVAMILAEKAELPVDLAFLEAHSLAGGNPRALVGNLIYARGHRLDVAPQAVAAHELAGRDPKPVLALLARVRNGDIDMTWDAAAALDFAGRDLDALAEELLALHAREENVAQRIRELISESLTDRS